MRDAAVIRTKWFPRLRRRSPSIDAGALDTGNPTYGQALHEATSEVLSVVGIKVMGRVGKADRKVAARKAKALSRSLTYAWRAEALRQATQQHRALHRRLDEEASRRTQPVARRIGSGPYHLAVAGLGAADAVVLSSAFQVLGEGTWLTRLLGVVFALALELIAAFIGAELQRWRFRSVEAPSHGWFRGLTIGAVAALLTGGYGAVAMRHSYFSVVLAGTGIAIPQWAVFALQLPILGSATIVGYLHANPLLDDIHYWTRRVRWSARRAIRAHRRLARAVSAHRRAWFTRRSLIGQHLELASAHLARFRHDLFTWLHRNDVEVLSEKRIASLVEVEPVAWVAALASDPRLTGSPADDMPELPNIGWLLDDAGFGPEARSIALTQVTSAADQTSGDGTSLPSGGPFANDRVVSYVADTQALRATDANGEQGPQPTTEVGSR